MSKSHHPYLALLAGIVCISLSALFVKWAALPGGTSAFYRAAFALLGAIPLWFATGVRLPTGRSTLLIALGGVAFAVELILWQSALLKTSAANATLLVNLAPVWVGLLAAVVLRERQSLRFWGGAAVAIAGMIVVVLARKMGALHAAFGGDLMAAAGSLFYAIYLLVTRQQRKSVETGVFLFVSTVSVAIVTFVFASVHGDPLSGFTHVQWVNLIALGLVTHFGGYLAINYALGHIEAPRVAIALLGQPVFTAVLAASLLGEKISVTLLLGGLITLVGLYLALFRSAMRKRNDQRPMVAPA